MTAATTIDTHEWLEAIDNHPETTGQELLAGYQLLGVDTELSEAQCAEAMFTLLILGFLRPRSIEADGNVYEYELTISPGRQ